MNAFDFHLERVDRASVSEKRFERLVFIVHGLVRLWLVRWRWPDMQDLERRRRKTATIIPVLEWGRKEYPTTTPSLQISTILFLIVRSIRTPTDWTETFHILEVFHIRSQLTKAEMKVMDLPPDFRKEYHACFAIYVVGAVDT